MVFPEPRRSQALFGVYLGSAFALSAVTDLRVLGGCWLAALILLHRGADACLKKVAVTVVPFTATLSLASWLWQHLLLAQPTNWEAQAGLNLRAALIAFVTLATMRRLNLCRAVEFSPTLSRLLAITLAQIHALRLLGTESWLGLKSRLVTKPGAADVLHSAGAVTGSLLTISAKHSRDVADALRSRGV